VVWQFGIGSKNMSSKTRNQAFNRTVCSGAFASQILRPTCKALRPQAGFALPVNLALGAIARENDLGKE
jgi:hypothetical protein